MQGPGAPAALVRGGHRVVGHQVRAPAPARGVRLRAQVHPLDTSADRALQRRRRQVRGYIRMRTIYIRDITLE